MPYELRLLILCEVVQLQLQRPAYLPLAHFRVDLTRVLTLDLLVGYEEAVVLEKAPQNLNYLLLVRGPQHLMNALVVSTDSGM